MPFTTTLYRHEAPGGWVFAPIPAEHAPPTTHPWGRTPVRATVDGKAWDTSVWRATGGGSVLAVPKRIRGAKDHGDEVVVELVGRMAE